jgi:tetratricopeptide (TPR) repeat protein
MAMFNTLLKAALAATVVLVLGTAVAADESTEPRAGDQETKKVQTLSQKVHKVLVKAQESAEAGDYSGSLEILDALMVKSDKGRMNTYETATIHNFYAVNYYQMEKYSEAISAYEKVIAQPDIPDGLRQSAMFSIAQLNFVTENFQGAVDILKEWFRISEDPSSQAFVMIAQAYYQLEQYQNVPRPLIIAIKKAGQKKKPIKENWLALLRAAYYEVEDYESTSRTLELLVKMYPKKSYWIQLSGVYGLMDRESDQAAAMEAAYQGGFLDKGTEYVMLGQLLLGREVPYKAGSIIQEGMDQGLVEKSRDNWQLLAQAWAMAQELDKQIIALQAAAKLATDDGQLDYYLGQALSDKESWDQAIDAFRSAIKKGVDRPDRARMSLGMAYFNADQLDEARASFVRAARDDRSAKGANQWVNYLDTELSRRRALAAAGL